MPKISAPRKAVGWSVKLAYIARFYSAVPQLQQYFSVPYGFTAPQTKHLEPQKYKDIASISIRKKAIKNNFVFIAFN
jgi:hypothetical protein